MNYPGYLDNLLADSAESSQLRSILFDGVTGLPTLPLVLESLRDVASEQHTLGILVVNTSGLESVEEEHGWEEVDKFLRHVRSFLDTITSRFSPLKVFSIHRTVGDAFLLILSSTDVAKPVSVSQLSQISTQLEELLYDYLSRRLTGSMLPFARMYSGYSILQYSSNMRFERLMARAINEAFRVAVSQQERIYKMQIQQLQEIVNGNAIRVVFQPIFDLKDRRTIIGHESLSRGPEGTLFESAEYMFTLAARCGLLNRLENLCQVRLLSTLDKQPAPHLVFVNLEPSFLEGEGYQKLALFNDPRVKPESVVIEITERIAIKEYETVSRALDTLRKRGFRIAIDDVGSGYASLQSIAYLKPDYIKINEKMINGIHEDFIKQEIVKTLRDLARRFSASLIAEGIEATEDIETLSELKIPYGQGFLLQRPGELQTQN